MRIRCAFEGCHKTTDQANGLVPPKGWCFLSDWGPGIADGYYCRAHRDAIEQLEESGELEFLQQHRG
jgi:hypothetical protein